MNPRIRRCSLNILHLEDDPSQSGLLKTELEAREIPCSITRVWTHDAFKAALTNGQIDVVVASWGAPGIDGMATLAEARQQCPGVPFVFLAKQGMPNHVRVEAFRKGAADFINNCDMPKLGRALNGALYSKQKKLGQLPKPEVGLPVLIECDEMRCLGYLDDGGKWRDGRTSEEIIGVTGLSAV